MLSIVEVGSDYALSKYEAACRAVAEAKSVDEVKDILNSAAAMRAYGQQAKDDRLVNDALEIRDRAKRRIGEMMKSSDLKRGGDRKSKVGDGPLIRPPTLEEAGIDKHLADDARKLAAMADHEFEKKQAERRAGLDKKTDLLGKAAHLAKSSGENEWYTPSEYVEMARKVLGDFDTDPASNETAQAVVKAGVFFTKESDGLAQDWHGRVWMNPPYSQPEISQFSEKLIAELTAGRVTDAIVLTNDSTDTAWFHLLASHSLAVCFPRRRIRFMSSEGEMGSPLQGQTFFYLGPDVDLFAEVFGEIGLVFSPVNSGA